MKKIHLICNAHIDPVWLWQWEEGAAEAVSTFRVAADFCEEYDGFIFNHNEAILYKWVEEYEPKLFEKIKRLVKENKWHIMGGWYLQPDCNMPRGESIIRQIIYGKRYFREKFGVEPSTAINFDSFGHSRGLVQILNKAGFDSYIVCRPDSRTMAIKDSDFIWKGYDGSEILVHRSDENYNSVRGMAALELKEWFKSSPERDTGIFLWGIGNHGGGPSKIDLDNIKALIHEEKNRYEIAHSNPENYFKELRNYKKQLQELENSLNPVADGCYTSQIRVKQKHRALENDIFMVEKMCSSAAIQGYMDYPKVDIDEALNDLFLSEFHDALPGSAIQAVEEDTLRQLDHGLEITSRLKTKAFFALAKGQCKVKNGETPILIYNPHPFKIKSILECEFVLPSQNWKDEFTMPMLYQGDRGIPCQSEVEASNFRMDWRKKAVFNAELMPSQMNRFDFKFNVMPKKPEVKLREKNGKILFYTSELQVEINCDTGLIDKYEINGINYIKKNAFLPLVMNDCYNSWGTGYKDFEDIAGKFTLMNNAEIKQFTNLDNEGIKAVRVIEDGEVRTVLEVLFKYNNSNICMLYKLPKEGTELQVDIKVFWNEKDKMLKLSVPTIFEKGKYIGETMYGCEELKDNGSEVVSQRWSMACDNDNSFSVINDGIYGSNYKDGEIRISLIRSPGYSTTDFLGRIAMPQDRYTPRMDQGERDFSLWVNGGKFSERIHEVSKEALVHNERPFIISFCPSGEGKMPSELITLSNDKVQLTAFKRAEASENFIIRLFEPIGQNQMTKISIPIMSLDKEVTLKPYEIKTLELNIQEKTLQEGSILD